LCLKQDPSDIEIVGTGKLILHKACMAYGARVLIQAQTITIFNNTEKDVIPPLSLEYDYCISKGKPAKLKDFHLELPLKKHCESFRRLKVSQSQGRRSREANR
jgi:hypothetical protein